MQFKERRIAIQGCFCVRRLHKAFNLLNAKRLSLAAQSDTVDLKSKVCISNACSSRCPLYFMPASIGFRWHGQGYYFGLQGCNSKLYNTKRSSGTKTPI